MPARTIYTVELRHKELHKYRLIRGTDRQEVEAKAHAQALAWDDIWAKQREADAKKQKRAAEAKAKDDKKALAAERTEAAQEALAELDQVLSTALKLKKKVTWESLLDHTQFAEATPSRPNPLSLPREPKDSDSAFRPESKWYYLLRPSLRERAQELMRQKFVAAHRDWLAEIATRNAKNKDSLAQFNTAVAEWKRRREAWEQDQHTKNAQTIARQDAYKAFDSEAVSEFCDVVMSVSEYPPSFPHEWNVIYQNETKTLVVDYFLPSPDDLPRLKEVKYVASKDDLTEVFLADSAVNKIYDNLLYQLTLRTIYELYLSDQAETLAAIVFNGWVRSIDKGTGKSVTACVLSLQAARKEFLDIDLRNVDPKECFRTLKGVGSSKLHGLSPIAPILQLNKEDKRFVPSHSVVGELDQSTNLAAMDWEEFEHLIREVFEQEFSQNGGEVKITQASRDGGVDAVAFDPDPIRGGKIVIQAKRYTNIVGVSAVRDLYGTVMNEGATKGILVTTADYGPDSYAFAKGKPLTLLNGANLLHLLAKYGHKASIDLKAAKQMLADQESASRA